MENGSKEPLFRILVQLLILNEFLAVFVIVSLTVNFQKKKKLHIDLEAIYKLL